MGRAPCCDKANVKKGPWSPEEDAKLKDYIQKFGTGGNWIALPQKVGLKRCGKSCRLRWLNYLRPNIKHGEFSDEEDRIICTLFANIGSRWSIIAAQLPGRTDNDIKNYWNTKLKKKLMSFVSHNTTNNNININITSPLQYDNINNNINHGINSITPQRKFMINPQFQNSTSHHETNSNSIVNNTTSSMSHLNIPSSSFYQNTPTTMMMMMMNSNTTFDSTNSSSSISSYTNNNNNNNNNLINFQGHHGQEDKSFVGYDNNNNQYNNNYYHMIKDNISSNMNNNVVMFGSGSNNEASCSTSSDGSCNYQIKQELEMGFHGQSQTSFVGLLNNVNNYGGNNYNISTNNNNLMWGQKPISGYLDDNYYQVSDVKQVISATTTSCSNANNSFFNVDENKTQENINNFNSKVMYF